mgnify:FL=1
MNTFFIASRLRYKRRIVTVSIAISYIVMIVAMAVSAGFRCEVSDALSQVGGDIQLCPANMSILEESQPVNASPAYLPLIEDVQGVESVNPAIYRAGIVKVGDNIHGVVVKGIETSDPSALAVSIPRRLSEAGEISIGDKMMTYFVGNKIRVRNFNVTSIYDPQIETDDRFVVYASLGDIQRLNAWSENQVSMLEIRMKPDYRGVEQIETAAQEIASIAYSYTSEDEAPVYVTSTPSRYPQLFDWLNLLDFNVLFVLVLMMIVAGFNMISGLLITLFENISTIGIFKAMGMKNRQIAGIFLTSSATTIFKGMSIGNIVACVLCLIEDRFHLLKLDAANYFVSFVPVNLDIVSVLTVDVISFALIMLLLLIPCAFISRIDPAKTMRVR